MKVHTWIFGTRKSLQVFRPSGTVAWSVRSVSVWKVLPGKGLRDTPGRPLTWVPKTAHSQVETSTHSKNQRRITHYNECWPTFLLVLVYDGDCYRSRGSRHLVRETCWPRTKMGASFCHLTIGFETFKK